MFRAICSFVLLKLMKWDFHGSIDNSVHKYIIIVAPHTSNWDFPIGVMARSILRIEDAKFLGKSQLFKWPFGILFRALGGYPVDRTKHNNIVDAAVEIFNSKEKFAMALAPEGTRSKVEKMKTGFYHIAVKAKIPIFMVGFDFAKKTIVINEPFYPTGDLEADMIQIMRFYNHITPRHPELGL